MEKLTSNLQSNDYVIGIREVLRAVKSGIAELVYIATDADSTYKQKVLDISVDVKLLSVATMQEMALAVRCEVPTAAIAILKRSK